MTSPAPNVQAAGPPDEEALDVYGCYVRSPWLSIKHRSYFQTYTDLLERFRGTDLTFVEIGVLNGGSLFMWREYLGPKARIVGVDLNPQARRWTESGFEIHIGDQSDEGFWRDFFAKVGPVDVVLDDGGHTYLQQVVTASQCIPMIRDGGVMIVEDTHTSYFPDFGYPGKYTFMEWVKGLMDQVNARFPQVHVHPHPLRSLIHSITVHESIVSFRIDRNQCITNSPVSNGGTGVDAQDFRHAGSSVGWLNTQAGKLGTRFPALKQNGALRLLKSNIVRLVSWTSRLRHRKQLKRYF